MRKPIQVMTVVTGLLYAIGAFTNGSFNSGEWDGFGRLVLAFLWSTALIATVCFHIWANPTQPHPGRNEPIVPPSAPRGKRGKVVQFRR